MWIVGVMNRFLLNLVLRAYSSIVTICTLIFKNYLQNNIIIDTKSIYYVQNIDISQNMDGIVMDRYCLILRSVLWIFNGREPLLYHSKNREPFSVITVVKMYYYRGHGSLRNRKESD